MDRISFEPALVRLGFSAATTGGSLFMSLATFEVVSVVVDVLVSALKNSNFLDLAWSTMVLPTLDSLSLFTADLLALKVFTLANSKDSLA